MGGAVNHSCLSMKSSFSALQRKILKVYLYFGTRLAGVGSNWITANFKMSCSNRSGLMSTQRTELESFVRTTLNNENDYFTKQIIVRYGERFMEMVQTLEINERTIAPGLKIMAEEIFLYGAGFYHVLTFLVFCIALDKHCKMNSWYTQKKLIDIIVNILYDANFIPPSPPRLFSFNICTIL